MKSNELKKAIIVEEFSWAFILREFIAALKNVPNLLVGFVGAISVFFASGVPPHPRILIWIYEKLDWVACNIGIFLNEIGVHFIELIPRLVTFYYIFFIVNLRGKIEKYPQLGEEISLEITKILTIINVSAYLIFFFFFAGPPPDLGTIIISVIIASIFIKPLINFVYGAFEIVSSKISLNFLYILLAPLSLLFAYYVIVYPLAFLESYGNEFLLIRLLLIFPFFGITILVVVFLTPILTYVVQVPRSFFGTLLGIIALYILNHIFS